MNLKETLLKLCCTPGVSGHEEKIGQVISTMLKSYSNDIFVNSLGSVIAKISNPKNNYPKILLEAHMDEIGLIVTSITDDGFIKVSNCGGVDVKLLIAQEVVVHGKSDLYGVVCSVPPHLNTKKDSLIKMDDICIDIGMNKQNAEKLVSPGDVVTYNFSSVMLHGHRVASKSLDNRSGVAAILLALDKLKGKDYNCGVSVMFSSLEETSGKGALTGGYLARPDISFCVDVSFAKSIGCPKSKCKDMGKGVMIGYSPTLDSKLSLKLKDIAEKNNIPHQMEIMSGLTSTDADKISTLRGGIVTGLCSIPLKYMHSPIEVIDLNDLDSVASLLSEFILQYKEG